MHQLSNLTVKQMPLLNFQQINPERVIKVVTATPNKSCILDPGPIFIVKECAQLDAQFIVLLFNQSVSESYMPHTQKAAIVKPIAKTRGLVKANLKHFQPVSNLTFLSKLLERAFSGQLTDFLDMNNLFSASQSAYTKFHSTESALLKV